MVRTIVKPESTRIFVEVPAEFVGKEIEVILSELSEPEFESAPPNPRPRAEDIFTAFRVDLTGFKFDRDEANER